MGRQLWFPSNYTVHLIVEHQEPVATTAHFSLLPGIFFETFYEIVRQNAYRHETKGIKEDVQTPHVALKSESEPSFLLLQQF